jgi:hypothetical protein
MMSRCMDCNSRLKTGEKQCFSCGAPAPGENTAANFGQHFATFIKFAFFVSIGLTVASLFLDFTPSFSKCAVSSVVLLLAKSSADQMLEKKKD